jgi:hypothetical protein
MWKRPWPGAWRTNPPSAAGQRITHLYQAMIAHLARRGLFKKPATTPLEFLRTIQKEWSPAGTAVATVTEYYCRARFGRTRLTPTELDQAEASLREVTRLERRAG